MPKVFASRQLQTQVGNRPANTPKAAPIRLPSGKHHSALVLQQAIGNQATAQLIQNNPIASSHNAPTPAAFGLEHGVSSTNGQPLDPATRTQMELRFGHNFSQVQIRTDDDAAQLTDRHNAIAITQGKTIHFARNTYSPRHPASQAILAHELAHVVQGDRPSNRSQSSETALEAEAALASMQVSAGRSARIQLAAHQPQLMMRRSEVTTLSTIFSGLGGLALGAFGLGIAALAGATLGVGAIVGALVGGALGGALLGGLLGYNLSTRRNPVTPTEADLWIRGRFGTNLAATIAAGTSAVGSTIRVVNDAQFRAAYLAAHPDNPDADPSHVIAFVDRSTTPPTIWIHQDRQSPDTVLHEAMHIYSHPAIRRTLDAPGPDGKLHINEGITEYFSRQIADTQDLAIEGAYEDEYQEIRALVEVCGEDVLRQAYFEGNIAALRTAVDAARGAGTLDAWAVQMIAKNWSGARAALRPRR